MTNEPAPARTWQDMKRRFEQARAKLGKILEPSIRRERDILRERAEKLAAPPPEEQEKGDILTVVEFRLGRGRCGLECTAVAEVLEPGPITPLPGAPAFWAGIIDVRGRIVPVLCLEIFFKLPVGEITALTRVIILGRDAGKDGGFGILTRELSGTRTLPQRELLLASPTLTGIGEKYIKGVTRDRLVLLDAGEMLKNFELKEALCST